MASVPKPLPVITPENAPFWEGCRNGHLLLQRCTGCAAWRYPPASVCPRCGSLEVRWSPVSRRGTIYSFVVYHRAFHPASAAEIPYVVALVDLGEGVRMVMRVAKCPVASVTIDMEGRIELQKVTEELWVPVFVPTTKISLRSALPPLSKGE